MNKEELKIKLHYKKTDEINIKKELEKNFIEFIKFNS